MIWEPFAMALVLGLLMSAGLYFAYLWPSVEPDEDEVAAPEAKVKVKTEAKGEAKPAAEKPEPATEEPETPPPSVAETTKPTAETAKDDKADA